MYDEANDLQNDPEYTGGQKVYPHPDGLNATEADVPFDFATLACEIEPGVDARVFAAFNSSIFSREVGDSFEPIVVALRDLLLLFLYVLGAGIVFLLLSIAMGAISWALLKRAGAIRVNTEYYYRGIPEQVMIGTGLTPDAFENAQEFALVAQYRAAAPDIAERFAQELLVPLHTLRQRLQDEFGLSGSATHRSNSDDDDDDDDDDDNSTALPAMGASANKKGGDGAGLTAEVVAELRRLGDVARNLAQWLRTERLPEMVPRADRHFEHLDLTIGFLRTVRSGSDGDERVIEHLERFRIAMMRLLHAATSAHEQAGAISRTRSVRALVKMTTYRDLDIGDSAAARAGAAHRGGNNSVIATRVRFWDGGAEAEDAAAIASSSSSSNSSSSSATTSAASDSDSDSDSENEMAS